MLASASEARATLLRNAGVVFRQVVAGIDEAAFKPLPGEPVDDPAAVAATLARAKAGKVSAQEPDAWVIGADQVLAFDGAIFDTPVNGDDARAHLLQLRGREHHLHSAVAVTLAGDTRWQHVATARLVVRPFSEAFLDAYVAEQGAALTTSVGAYQLEGAGAQLFFGLPLLPLLDFLRQSGVLRQ